MVPTLIVIFSGLKLWSAMITFALPMETARVVVVVEVVVGIVVVAFVVVVGARVVVVVVVCASVTVTMSSIVSFF